MNVHELLTGDHKSIRDRLAEVQAAVGKDATKLERLFGLFQKEVTKHFHREDVYYRVLDDGKRVNDRGLMHDLRNDHAAIVFTLESLAIRLRKKSPASEWKKKFDHMVGILLSHLDREEKELFPRATQMLTPAVLSSILQEINSLS